MKKLISLLLVLTLAMSLAACGGSNNSETAPSTEATTETTTGATSEGTDQITDDTTASVETPEPNDATKILSAIWAAVEGEKFFAMGGDLNSMVSDDAGNYSLEDEGLTTTLYVPADQITNLDQASSLVHGMLLNNFTCGVFRMAEDADAAAFADAMKASIGSAQWICGMPEKLVIAIIDGEYVLAAFGINDAIAPFETALGNVYPDAEVKYSEAITG